MAGTVIPCVLVVFCAALTVNCVSALPKDIIFPADDESHIENLKSIDYLPSVNQHLKQPESEDKPKNCFHFFVSRNMSSLLADATKMLRTIRDRREREWILTFIYRIKSLAEHLRSHPESRNYECLSTEEEAKKRILSGNAKGQQQPEIYFVDDVPKRSIENEDASEKTVEKSLNDNQDINLLSTEEKQSIPSAPPQQEIMTKNNDYISPVSKPQTESSLEVLVATEDISPSESSNEQKDESLTNQESKTLNQPTEVIKTDEKKDSSAKDSSVADNSIVLSSTPDCDSPSECFQNKLSSRPASQENYDDTDGIYPPYQATNPRQDFGTAEFYQQEALKERIKSALLEELAPEVKKLQAVGGSLEDLTNLWNSNYVQEDKSLEQDENTDFDYLEQGAALGDLNMNEKVQPHRTVAPSLDEVQNSKENSNNVKDSSYEPYDDSDVLVQQLFDVRFNEPPSKTTKSLGDQNNEYLITSTQTPF